MPEKIERLLFREYGIRALSMRAIPPGWSASAWKVHSDAGDYFLKVYDRRKPSAQGWVARIDDYMPAVLWLHENTDLRGGMVAPLRAKDGAYKREDADFLYIVFPFIAGRTIGGQPLRPAQVRELARIAARLHAHGDEIPVPTGPLRETFDIPFCTALDGQLRDIRHFAPLEEALTPHVEALARATAALRDMADALRHAKMRYALCHADIHGWNLMQSDRLILIDWEGLRLAPVEADLFSFTGTYFFDYAWEDFMAAYRALHNGYQVNADAMRFYRLRRRLEDIQAFVESVLLDNLAPDDVDRSLRCLKRECDLLYAVV